MLIQAVLRSLHQTKLKNWIRIIFRLKLFQSLFSVVLFKVVVRISMVQGDNIPIFSKASTKVRTLPNSNKKVKFILKKEKQKENQIKNTMISNNTIASIS